MKYARLALKKILAVASLVALILIFPSFALAAVFPTSGATPNVTITASGFNFFQVYPPDQSVMIFYARDDSSGGSGTFNVYTPTCSASPFCNNPNSVGSTNQSGVYTIFQENSQASSCFTLYPSIPYSCWNSDGTVSKFTYTASSCVGGCAVTTRFFPPWDF